MIIGGLNWGLVGLGMLFGNSMEAWNVVHIIFAVWLPWPVVEGIIYVLVGIAALYKIFGCHCKKCKAACAACAVEGKPEEKVEGKM